MQLEEVGEAFTAGKRSDDGAIRFLHVDCVVKVQKTVDVNARHACIIVRRLDGELCGPFDVAR